MRHLASTIAERLLRLPCYFPTSIATPVSCGFSFGFWFWGFVCVLFNFKQKIYLYSTLCHSCVTRTWWEHEGSMFHLEEEDFWILNFFSYKIIKDDISLVFFSICCLFFICWFFFFAFISSKFKQLTGSSNQKFENFHFYFVFKIQIKLLELILYLTGSFIWPLSLLPLITALIIWHKVITEKRKSRLCLSYPWRFSGVFLVTNLS